MSVIEKQYDKPLYEDIIWSRPQRRTGRVLLVGGHRDGFANLQRVFAGFDKAEIAEAHLALPDKLSKLVGSLEGISLVPSTPSGSIARDATAELVHLANESDAVCLGPDLSNNSETTLTMQRVIQEARSAIIIPPESAEQLMSEAGEWKDRDAMLLFINQKQLYKLATILAADVSIPLQPTADTLAEMLVEVSKLYKPSLILMYENNLIIAVDGQGSVTRIKNVSEPVGLLGTFWLQNSSKRYEALTAAAHLLDHSSDQ